MPTRASAFWAGFRRGAKFGGIVGIIIWLAVWIVCITIFVFIPDLRAKLLEDLSGKGWLAIIGNIVAPLALMILYGVIPGSIIMGIAGLLRAGRNDDPNTN